MKHILLYLSVTVFSIFIGSQITEGILLVPYWQSLAANDFYDYYHNFGSSIGQFYTVLTIIAAAIPILLSFYCKSINSSALKPALISAAFAILFVSAFYIYFKDANELFYQAALSDVELKNELITWRNWHWGRVLVECISLGFLVVAIFKVQSSREY